VLFRSLELHSGELVGVLGPNGSGKTTLLLALAGVLAPTSGQVLLGGRDAARLRGRERARGVAAVPQRPEPSLGLAVRSYVLMGRYPYVTFLGGYGPEDEAAAEAALERAGLLPLADRRADTLSGGELQRAAIARALAQDADVLLLDEATSGLDLGRRVEAMALMEEKIKASRFRAEVLFAGEPAFKHIQYLLGE